MKSWRIIVLVILLILSCVAYKLSAQVREDSVKQVELKNDFEFFQKQKAAIDSQSIGYSYIMHYLYQKSLMIEEKKRFKEK